MDVSNQSYISPYSCYINLTSKCNLRCKHCFGGYSKEIHNELGLKDWKKVIDELVRCNIFYIVISGGEPTQSPIFKDFIGYLIKKGIYFILTTNGVFSKDIRDFIVKNRDYLISIKISLDGPDAESHGFIRLDSNEKYNSKIFDLTMDNLYFFKRKKIPLKEALKFAVYFHNEFQHIHPFEDGNSRTTRLITFHLLQSLDIPIIDIPFGLLDEYLSYTKGSKNREDIKLYQSLQKIILFNLKKINKRLSR